MISLGLLATLPIILWTAQSVLRRRAGLPIRLAIDFADGPPHLRTMGRVFTQASLAAVIIAYPLLRGRGVLDDYAALLPADRRWLQLPHGAAASVLFLCVLFGAWLATDQLQVDVHHSRRKWQRRLLLLVPTALLGALVEEIVFRGIVLADLLDDPRVSPSLATATSAVVFAAAHYVRRVKRRWTFPGHVLLGVLLGVAFVKTRTLWLSAGLHAGGIFMIMGTRPFVRYRGPTWLIGASIFPFAGLVGLSGLAILTAFVAGHYGAHAGGSRP